MAITGTDRGVGSHNSSSGTLVATPQSTIPAGSGGILVVAIDNSGSGGATAILPTSSNDSVGNTWTRRVSGVADPAGVSAGVEIAIYTCDQLSVALTSSNNLTLTLGANATAKAYVFSEATPTAGFKIQYVTGAASAAFTSGSPTVTTSSITNGNIVIGGGGAESNDTWAGDADSTNGTWSTHQHTVAGSGTTGMSVTSQRKVVTATATQTYNPTLTAADNILAWIELTEVASGHPAALRTAGILGMGVGGLKTGRGW